MPERIINCPRCNSTKLIEVKTYNWYHFGESFVKFMVKAKCMHCSYEFEFETLPKLEYGDL